MQELFTEFKQERRQTHQRVLALAADLTDDQLRWRPDLHAPGIGFHIWHLARWADHDRQIIGGGDQIWRTQKLAARWGLEGADLGPVATGMGMGDEAAERLVLPEKAVLIAYAQEAFDALDGFVDPLTLEQFSAPTRPPDDRQRPVRNVLLTHLVHDNRRLGMI